MRSHSQLQYQAMLYYQQVDMEMLSQLGKEYEWERPPCCLKCHSTRVWGHGFVRRFFEGFAEALLFWRIRCEDCRCVMQVKPLGFLKWLQTPLQMILDALDTKIETTRWPTWCPRQRGGHWLRRLVERIRGDLRGQLADKHLRDVIALIRTGTVKLLE